MPLPGSANAAEAPTPATSKATIIAIRATVSLPAMPRPLVCVVGPARGRFPLSRACDEEFPGARDEGPDRPEPTTPSGESCAGSTTGVAGPRLLSVPRAPCHALVALLAGLFRFCSEGRGRSTPRPAYRSNSPFVSSPEVACTRRFVRPPGGTGDLATPVPPSPMRHLLQATARDGRTSACSNRGLEDRASICVTFGKRPRSSVAKRRPGQRSSEERWAAGGLGSLSWTASGVRPGNVAADSLGRGIDAKPFARR